MYYLASSLLRNWRLSTYHPNAGSECAGHRRAFLGNREVCLMMHLVTVHRRDRVSPEQSLAHWEGNHASHQPCTAWNSSCGQRGWLFSLRLSRDLSAHWEGRKRFFTFSSFLLSASTAEDAQQPPISLLIQKRFVFMENLLIERSLCV